ncbi:hypothetical protein T439DRAFT_321699 [Meredithblackwellia eburnea MCA 4105]
MHLPPLRNIIIPAAAILNNLNLAAAQSSVVGTWSSGVGSVLTGPAFGDPTEANTFIYPNVSGRALSFTSDGYYEEASFLWNSNATDHHCIEAVVIWQHGTYTMNSNGSISTSSEIFAADGRIQVQNACAAQSSVISYYSQAGLYATWAISQWRGKTMLQLGRYDGALLPRMYQISTDPSQYMFPTSLLSNVSATDVTSSSKFRFM